MCPPFHLPIAEFPACAHPALVFQLQDKATVLTTERKKVSGLIQGFCGSRGVPCSSKG